MKFPMIMSRAGPIPPLLFINWFFGIGVVEYPIGVPRPVISAVWSTMHLMIYLGFLRLANFSEIETINGSVIVANIYCFIAYLGAVFLAISFCLTHMGAKVVAENRKALINLNDRLNRLGIPLNYETAFKAQITRVSVVFVYIFSVILLDTKYMGFDLPSETSRIGILAVSHHFLVFAFIVDSTFTGAVGFTGTGFENLNKFLVDSDPGRMRKTTITEQSDDQFEFYLSVISEIHGNSSLKIKGAEKQWLLFLVRETRIIHRSFYKLAIQINKALGVQILFSVGLSFSVITTLLYTSYVVAATSSFSGFFDYSYFVPKIIVLMWFSFYVIKVIFIVNACDATSYEANRTGLLISKLLNTAACDEDIRDEINNFSLELLQNPLKFTASGFFALDYSLVHGIIGSVTTYLVILIQMRSIYEPEGLDTSFNSTMLVETNITN